jgi:C4-dicarboxylate transporter DctQ subunit
MSEFLDRTLTRLENIVMFSALMGALAIGVVQVLCRFVLNTGVVWSELAVVTLTVLASFVGGARAAAKGAHVRITMLAEALPAHGRRYIEVLALLVSVAYCLVMAYASWLYISFLYDSGMVSSEADVPLWLIFLMTPVSMVLFCVRFLQGLPAAWNGRSIGHTEIID